MNVTTSASHLGHVTRLKISLRFMIGRMIGHLMAPFEQKALTFSRKKQTLNQTVRSLEPQNETEKFLEGRVYLVMYDHFFFWGGGAGLINGSNLTVKYI